MPACEVALLSVLSALWRSEIEPSWKQISSFEEIVQGNWLPPARSNKIIHLKRTLKQIQRRWMLGSSTSPVPFTSSSRAPPLLSSSSSVQRTTREPARGSSPDEKNFIKEDGSAPENLNLRPRGGNCSPIARSIIRKMSAIMFSLNSTWLASTGDQNFESAFPSKFKHVAVDRGHDFAVQLYIYNMKL